MVTAEPVLSTTTCSGWPRRPAEIRLFSVVPAGRCCDRSLPSDSKSLTKTTATFAAAAAEAAELVEEPAL